MKVTPLEIRTHQLRKAFKGYDISEVEALREIAADALEAAGREILALEEKLRSTASKLSEQMANENVLKETLVTAQKIVEDFKENARKEAELVLTEARLQAEEIVRQAHKRSEDVAEEIHRLKKQRAELESQIKAVLDYHSSTLLLEEEESRKADEEAEKIKFLPNK